MSELQEEIGQVSKRFKNVAGEDFSFGYVYSIVDVDIFFVIPDGRDDLMDLGHIRTPFG